jgi:hypothetical protein
LWAPHQGLVLLVANGCGRGLCPRPPFRNSISRACRPTSRSSAAIRASYSCSMSAACASSSNPPASYLATDGVAVTRGQKLDRDRVGSGIEPRNGDVQRDGPRYSNEWSLAQRCRATHAAAPSRERNSAIERAGISGSWSRAIRARSAPGPSSRSTLRRSRPAHARAHAQRRQRAWAVHPSARGVEAPSGDAFSLTHSAEGS